MGLAKASLEASVRYLAYGLGGKGIRVNGISAGPDQDAGRLGHQGLRQAAQAVRRQRRHQAATSPIEDVGNTAAFLLSDLAGGISSEIVYVDGGFSHGAMAGTE